jgi:RNA binding exosome subunit
MGGGGSGGRVMSVEFSTITHATEDVDKVMEAVLNIVPPELRGSTLFNRRYLEGHYRNPIVILTANITEAKMAEAALRYIFTMLSRPERRELSLDFEKALDEDNNFYIRLDKQGAFRGILRLADRDPIRVKVKTRMWRSTVEGARKILEDLGMKE